MCCFLPKPASRLSHAQKKGLWDLGCVTCAGAGWPPVACPTFHAKGKHWISSVLCYALVDYINSFWFCFWTFNATERRFSSFLWIPRTLFVRSQIMSRNSEMTWISHEHNLSYTVSRQLGRARGRHVSYITLHADKLSQLITVVASELLSETLSEMEHCLVWLSAPVWTRGAVISVCSRHKAKTAFKIKKK